MRRSNLEAQLNGVAQREYGPEIGVGRNNYSMLSRRALEHLLVRRALHRVIANVNGIVFITAQICGQRTGIDPMTENFKRGTDSGADHEPNVFADAQIEDAWAAEVERRVEAIESGQASLISAAEAIAKARAAVRRR